MIPDSSRIKCEEIAIYGDFVLIDTFQFDVVDAGNKVFVDVVILINALRQIPADDPRTMGHKCYLVSELLQAI